MGHRRRAPVDVSRLRFVRLIASAQKRTQQCPLNLIREWSCYPEATPYEFLSAMEIEARAATKRNAKPSTQHRSGFGACCLTLASKLGGPHPRGIFLCNGHPPFALH